MSSAASPDPACPGCGMTAQVEPSRSEPGRWMCHGCARTFDAPDNAATTLPESEEDVRQALSDIAHLVRYEWRLRDHDIGLVLRTIEQVLDQYGIGVAS